MGKPCAYCAQPMGEGRSEPTKDHCFPRSAGFELRDFGGHNKMLVCFGCNQSKKHLDIVDWHERLFRGNDQRAPIVMLVMEHLLYVHANVVRLPQDVVAKLDSAVNGTPTVRRPVLPAHVGQSEERPAN